MSTNGGVLSAGWAGFVRGCTKKLMEQSQQIKDNGEGNKQA
jgi:hypothetical protein